MRRQALFEDHAHSTAIAMTLLEGDVMSTAPESKVLPGSITGRKSAAPAGPVLTPGDRLEVAEGGRQALSSFEPATALQWRSGMVQFANVTLAEAAAELNRCATTKIKVPDPDLAPSP